LIVGPHPVGGWSDPTQWIGTVTTIWNDAEQQVDGEFWFFDEEWERIPEEVRKRIVNKEKVSLSAGYQVGKVEDGIQIGRKWDHLALNVQNPKQEGIGVNVRMEAELPENFRVEETPEISGKEAPAETPPAPTKEDVQAWVAEAVAEAVAKALEAQKPAEPERSEEEPVTAPEEEVKEARPEPIPETVLPASAPSKKDEIKEVDGWWEL
jgi:hypothetical protein